MRIDHIQVNNYRCFEKFNCRFDPRLTLLMGENGLGKSSLLSAIVDSLGPLFETHIEEESVRHKRAIDPGDTTWRMQVYPCVIGSTVLVLGESFHLWAARIPNQSIWWPPELSKNHQTHLDIQRMQNLRDQWTNPLQPEPVPVIARFGASDSFNGSGKPTQVRQPFESKIEAWKRALETKVDVQLLAQWFQYNELRSLQEGSAPIPYVAARKAVLSAIHAVDIKYVVRDNQLMVHHKDQGWRPWEHLSDGQKRIAAIYCEIALRCATLNSHLAERCIVDSPGIVLIDELDLHLHPLWQRSVIGDLLRVFPSLQFIVASHSPFLLQAAFEYGKVVDMRTGEFVQPGDPSIEDIAETVMGVDQPQRGRRFLDLKAKATEYIQLLESKPTTPEELARVKAELDGHMADFANDPASAAWLAQQREAAGL